MWPFTPRARLASNDEVLELLRNLQRMQRQQADDLTRVERQLATLQGYVYRKKVALEEPAPPQNATPPPAAPMSREEMRLRYLPQHFTPGKPPRHEE